MNCPYCNTQISENQIRCSGCLGIMTKNQCDGCTAYRYDPRPKISGLYIIPNDYADPVYKERNPTNPQHWEYYFFDELWSEIHGPYSTEKLCREALRKYGDAL